VIKERLPEGKDRLKKNRKRIGAAILAVVILGAVSAGACALFQVKGVVTSVGDHSVTVANFLGTQTIDLTGAPLKAANIKVGDRIKIRKNLQGDIVYVKLFSTRNSGYRQQEKEEPENIEREYHVL